jgi:hypothetical protein
MAASMRAVDRLVAVAAEPLVCREEILGTDLQTTQIGQGLTHAKPPGAIESTRGPRGATSGGECGDRGAGELVLGDESACAAALDQRLVVGGVAA